MGLLIASIALPIAVAALGLSLWPNAAAARYVAATWDGLRLWLVKLYVHYRVSVSARTKCPACGHREVHKIVFSPLQEHLIHSCTFCQAVWPEKPMVATENWLIRIQPQMVEEEEPRVPFGAQREPIRMKAR